VLYRDDALSHDGSPLDLVLKVKGMTGSRDRVKEAGALQGSCLRQRLPAYKAAAALAKAAAP
jgi:hypothetical protein